MKLTKATKRERNKKLNKYLKEITDYHANGSYESLNDNVKLLNKESYAIMIRTTDFENNFKNSQIYIDEKAYNHLKKTKLKANDIIMNKIASPGKVYKIPKIKKPISLGMNLFKLIFKDDVNKVFMYYYLKKNEWFTKLFSNGTTTKTITKKELMKLKVIEFSIDEQKNIANLLSDKENHINNLKLLIEKLEKRNQYYANKLLTGELRVREDSEGNIEFYKNPDDNWKEEKVNGKIRKIPKDWEVENINDKNIKIINSGVSEFEGEKKYYATGDVGFYNDFLDSFDYVTFENRTSRANMEPTLNSAWFARMKNTNKFLYFNNKSDCNVVISTGFLGLSFNENKINSKYGLYYILNTHFLEYKNRLSYGSTQEAINNKSAKLLSFAFPDLNGQRFLIKILDNLYNEKEILKELLHKEKKQFEWLSEKLLSGEYVIEE
jgi:type I restriction enzyme S subunit